MRSIMQLGDTTLPTSKPLLKPSWLQLGATDKKKVHILALGDVGSTVLLGLVLAGGAQIGSIGIFDLSEEMAKRWEMEVNQICLPFAYQAFPQVSLVTEETLFDCDVFLFCASAAVPEIGTQVKDVRMIQFEKNSKIVSHYSSIASKRNYKGLFGIVSDPVDPLCQVAFQSALTANPEHPMLPEQFEGYGLGVMNARAAYYAKKDDRFASFLTEGRAFGPHGQDLVIANSILHYDDPLSRELTDLAVNSNLRTRDLGFKPYVAPALSSAALSVILTIQGSWHYSSHHLRGVFLGSNNRTTPYGLEWEVLELPEALFERIQTAYQHLEEIKYE